MQHTYGGEIHINGQPDHMCSFFPWPEFSQSSHLTNASLIFLLLPTWYTNFLFIHTYYIKLNSSTCFKPNALIIRRSTTQIVHMQPLVSSLSASDCLVQPLRQDWFVWMNTKFVYQVGNNKKSYTMMHGQPNIKKMQVCLFKIHLATTFTSIRI